MLHSSSRRRENSPRSETLRDPAWSGAPATRRQGLPVPVPSFALRTSAGCRPRRDPAPGLTPGLRQDPRRRLSPDPADPAAAGVAPRGPASAPETSRGPGTEERPPTARSTGKLRGGRAARAGMHRPGLREGEGAGSSGGTSRPVPSCPARQRGRGGANRAPRPRARAGSRSGPAPPAARPGARGRRRRAAGAETGRGGSGRGPARPGEAAAAGGAEQPQDGAGAAAAIRQ